MLRRPLPLALPLAAALAAFPACQLEQMFPEKVASGAARLTVRNTAAIVKLINADTACGFSSEASISGAENIGEIGEVGVLRQRVDNCEIDMGSGTVVSTDCNGVEMTVSGKVTVSGHRDVKGVLTSSPQKPVIPVEANAVELQLEAVYGNWEVRMSNQISAMTAQSGGVAFAAYIPLAASSESGLCSIPTSHIRLTEVTYTDVTVTLDSGEGAPFDAEIPTSRLSAQLGNYGGAENAIEGSITVWDSQQVIPLADEDPALDPDYERENFEKAFGCTEELAQPLSYQCEDLGPKLAGGAAPLTIKTFGNIAKLAEARCFSQPGVLSSPTITGQVGDAGGQARWDVQNCVIELNGVEEYGQDCLDTKSSAQGRIIVSGSKTITGMLTGDTVEPVIPLSRNPAVISLTVEFDADKPFAITDNKSTKALFMRGGRMSGTSRPMVARDTQKGVCSVVTPIVTFEHIAIDNADATLLSDGRLFNFRIDSTALDAQSGQNMARENTLTGTFTIDGTDVAIPRSGDPILDPNYSATTFLTSFSCTPNMEMVASDADCSINKMLGENAARLLVLTAGTVTSMVNADGDCGFDDLLLLAQPTDVQGEVGDMGSISWEVESCQVADGGLFTYSTDCMGGQTMVGGNATLNANRTVYGERNTQYFVVDSIIPRSHEAVEVHVTEAQLQNFVVYQLAAGATEPAGKLTIHQATLTADVNPRTGERADEAGVFDIPTPAAELASVHIASADATLESGGKTFSLALADVQLYARNGVFGGFGNQVSGSMRVNGELVEFGPIDLNPDYDQSRFDAAYACTENLASPVPTQ